MSAVPLNSRARYALQQLQLHPLSKLPTQFQDEGLKLHRAQKGHLVCQRPTERTWIEKHYMCEAFESVEVDSHKRQSTIEKHGIPRKAGQETAILPHEEMPEPQLG